MKTILLFDRPFCLYNRMFSVRLHILKNSLRTGKENPLASIELGCEIVCDH